MAAAVATAGMPTLESCLSNPLDVVQASFANSAAAPGSQWEQEVENGMRSMFNTAEAVKHWLRHVRYIVQRTNSLTGVAYRDDPTIMAWELANEPRAMKAVAGYRRWLNQSAVLIKSLDPHHLVTTGTEGRTPFARSHLGTDFLHDHSYAAIDYATVHVWAQRWGWAAHGVEAAAAMTRRMPTGSTATGFSMKTCLPAATQASKCCGRKCGGVARRTTSTPESMTF